MNAVVHYRITRTRAGLPSDYTGARRITAQDDNSVEDAARSQLATDYQVPHSAVEIIQIVN